MLKRKDLGDTLESLNVVLHAKKSGMTNNKRILKKEVFYYRCHNQIMLKVQGDKINSHVRKEINPLLIFENFCNRTLHTFAKPQEPTHNPSFAKECNITITQKKAPKGVIMFHNAKIKTLKKEMRQQKMPLAKTWLVRLPIGRPHPSGLLKRLLLFGNPSQSDFLPFIIQILIIFLLYSCTFCDF